MITSKRDDRTLWNLPCTGGVAAGRRLGALRHRRHDAPAIERSLVGDRGFATRAGMRYTVADGGSPGRLRAILVG